jgi:hypothetical protein
MGRPIKKKYFGNTNIGSSSSRSDNGIGGEGFSNVIITNSGTLYSTVTNAVFWTASAPQLVGGIASTGTFTVQWGGGNNGKVTAINITEPGSGYSSTSSVTITTTPATTGSAVQYIVVLGNTQQNALNITAWVPTATGGAANTSGSSINGGDIVKQEGTKRYYVKNSQGYGVCGLTTGTVTRGFMSIIATDWNGNTYWVTRLEARKARLWQKTQNGTNPWVYATNALAKWTFGASTGTTSTSVTTAVTIANA